MSEVRRQNHYGPHCGINDGKVDRILGRLFGALCDILPVDTDPKEYNIAYTQVRKIIKEEMKA